MKIKSFRDLMVWNMAMELVPAIYEVARKLPRVEIYALGDQLRRAAVAVPANIAEGQARHHTREFIQFLGIAKGSLAETETLLIVAYRLNYITDEQLGYLETQIANLRRPLQGLINRLRERQGATH